MFSFGANGDVVPADATPVTLRGDAQVALSNFLLNGQFRLNYIEWRLFFSMLSCIEECDTEFKDYFIRVQDIIELADLKSGSHLYEEVSKNIKSLMSHVVEWEEGPNTTRYAHLVTDATYYKKQGIVKITPHPDMKPHLLQLRKEFTQAQLKQCIRFSSTYTSRIYMLLKQFDSPRAGYRIMSVTEFRFKLGLDYTQKLSKGKEVEYHLYPKYSDIRRWVLLPAQQEIAKTDIPFEFTPIKTGRKVTAIRFTLLKGRKLRATPEGPTAPEQLTERQALAYARMARFRFSDHQIRRILQNGSLTDINKACYEVENTNYNKLGHPIENKTAYAYGIFKKKFGLD